MKLFPEHIECKACLGGGFTGDTGNAEKDVCGYCHGLGLVLPKDAPKVCDYCEDITSQLRLSPFMADLSRMMCRECWEMTRKEYLASNGEDIGKFSKGVE